MAWGHVPSVPPVVTPLLSSSGGYMHCIVYLNITEYGVFVPLRPYLNSVTQTSAF